MAKTSTKKVGEIKPSHRGLLHKELGIPQGQKIGQKRLEAAKAEGERTGNAAEVKRATYALNFNDEGTHGTVTSIDMHHNGKHARITIAHGRRKVKGKGGVTAMGYDDRPTSTVLVPKNRAGAFKVGQRAGVGVIPMSDNDADEMPMPSSSPNSAKRHTPAKKKPAGKKRRGKPSASYRTSPIGAAMGVQTQGSKDPSLGATY